MKRARAAGFTLVELLAAIVILGLVVVGVAYTLSSSRGVVDRYALAREALARVELRLEDLQYPSAARDTMVRDTVYTLTPPLAGRFPAQEKLSVGYVDDAADGLGPADPDPLDYKRITVTVVWTVGYADSVSLTSYYAAKR